MNKLTSIRIKQNDNTYSEDIPVQVLANNVIWNKDSYDSIIDVIGQVNLDLNGSLQDQINTLDSKKIDITDLNNYVNNNMNSNITNWLNENVNPVGSAVVIDESFTVNGAAADAKITGDNLNSLRNQISQIDPLTNDIRYALLSCFKKVMWEDNQGQIYYNALYNALFAKSNPSYITAVYTQSKTIYIGDSLDDLKQDLVVRYYDSPDSIGTILSENDYDLIGRFSSEGGNIIIVSYNICTAPITVIVTSITPLSGTYFGTSSYGVTVSEELDGVKYWTPDTDNMIFANTESSEEYLPLQAGDENTEELTIYPIKIPDSASTIVVKTTLSHNINLLVRDIDLEKWTIITSDNWVTGKEELSLDNYFSTPGPYYLIVSCGLGSVEADKSDWFIGYTT